MSFTLSDALSRLPPGFSEFRPGSSAAAVAVVVLQQNQPSFFCFFFACDLRAVVVAARCRCAGLTEFCSLEYYLLKDHI